MKKAIVEASNRVLGIFLPEVKAQARCLEAFKFCKCIGLDRKRYIWNSTCTGCIRSGNC
ncbi:MAG: hypothetical protein IPJ65_05790 [Archangiaceae bacterium]|nr:hypothetical protein [Archangiaceae bacterium]